MGINRFETPRPQVYQSTYVPLPFDAMLKAGAMHQSRIDDNQSQADAISALLANVKSLDKVDVGGGTERSVADRQALLDYKASINKQLEDIASGYTDKGDINYSQKVRSLARQVYGDLAPEGKIGKIHAAATEYEKQQKMMQDAENFSTSPWRGESIYENRRKYADANGDAYTGTAQLSTGNINKFVDRNKEMDDLVKGISPVLTKLWADTTGQYIKSGKVTEVGKNKILNTVDAFLPNSQAFKDILEEHRYDQSIGDPNADAKLQANTEALRKAMLNKYLESNGDANLSADPYGLANYKDKLENDNTRAASTVTTEVTDNNLNLPNEVKDIKFNPDGSIATPTEPKATTPVVLDPMMGGVSHNIPEDFKAKEVAQNKFINELKTNNPSLSNLTPKDAYNAYVEAQQGNSRTPIYGKSVTDVESSFHNEVFKGGLNSKGISIARSKNGISDPTNLKTIADNLGLDEKELRAQTKDGYVTGIGNGNRPGQFILTVQDGEGQPTNLLVNGSPEQEKYYNRSYNATLLEKEGKTGTHIFKDPIDNENYISKTQISKDNPNSPYSFKTITYGAMEVPSTPENAAKIESSGAVYEKKKKTVIENGKKVEKEFYYVADPDQVFDSQSLLDADHMRYQNSSFYPKKAKVKSQQEYSTE